MKNLIFFYIMEFVCDELERRFHEQGYDEFMESDPNDEDEYMEEMGVIIADMIDCYGLTDSMMEHAVFYVFKEIFQEHIQEEVEIEI